MLLHSEGHMQKLVNGPVSSKKVAFTLAELLTTLAVIALLALLVLPAMSRTAADSQRITCADNLKRIGVAFKLFAADHQGLYPVFVPATQGGPPNQTAFFSSTNGYGPAYIYQVLGVLSNQLGSPNVLLCPADERTAGSNWSFGSGTPPPYGPPEGLNNNTISYFVGRDALDSKPRMLLCGDRNIYGTGPGIPSAPITFPNGGYGNGFPSGTLSGTALCMGTNISSSSLTPCWTPQKLHFGRGNVLFCDGGVQQLTNSFLRNALRGSGDRSTNPPAPQAPWGNVLLFP